MSKRKFADFKERQVPKSTVHDGTSQNQSRVQGVLDNGKTSLFRALKVARGFERQKLGRRQKTAAKAESKGDVARLEAETTALKALDLAKTAELHLYKTLLKIKSIASSTLFPRTIQSTVNAAGKPQSTASTTVQARLFNSAPVKTAMLQITNDIRNAMGIVEQPLNGKQAYRAEESASTYNLSNVQGDRTERAEEEISEDSWNGIQTSACEDDFENEHGSSDSEKVDFKAYCSRIAGSEDESTEQEDVNRHTNSDWSGSENGVDLVAQSDGPSEDEDLRYEKQISTTSMLQKPASTAPKSTTFLPSLSMGGYWSGSNSGSDIDDTAGKIEVRRNKRGQRARRAINEQKYGRNANHLKNQITTRDQGWDPRKGAQGEDSRTKGRKGWRGNQVHRTSNGYRKGAEKEVSSGANSDPVKFRAKGNMIAEGPLHPSWEAAKKAKEMKKPVSFQGKKITFD